jgi:hypothetical protein
MYDIKKTTYVEVSDDESNGHWILGRVPSRQ